MLAAEDSGEEVPEKQARANRMRVEEESEVSSKLKCLKVELNELLEEIQCELTEMDDGSPD